MMFNATFHNISAISLQSILLVDETGVSGENHRPVTSHLQTSSHNIVSSTPRLSRSELTTLMVIGTDCIGRYTSNYHAITTTMFPLPSLLFSTKKYGNIIIMIKLHYMWMHVDIDYMQKNKNVYVLLLYQISFAGGF